MTQYERGVKLERQIQHKYESHDFLVISSRGSHGDADLAVFLDDETMLIQCKLHEGLRDKIAEDRFKARNVGPAVSKWVAWKIKNRTKRSDHIRHKGLIVVQNLIDKSRVFYLEPLTKEEEKEYQEMKKAKIEARKLPRTNIRLLPDVQQTKTKKRSKS